MHDVRHEQHRHEQHRFGDFGNFKQRYKVDKREKRLAQRVQRGNPALYRALVCQKDGDELEPAAEGNEGG